MRPNYLRPAMTLLARRPAPTAGVASPHCIDVVTDFQAYQINFADVQALQAIEPEILGVGRVEAWRNAEFQRGRKLSAQELLIAVLPKVPDTVVSHVDERPVALECASYIKDADTVGPHREPVAATR